ncbi:MAG: response regulator, partial [Gammaproteobacteria bacterium]|nr:response regulator [Gammaproteobacteria bacterium]
GIGIDADNLQHIFDDFFQVGVANQNREGYGLGLGIVRRIAKRLDARIEVASTPGSGSTFTVILPAAKSSAPLAVERRAPVPPRGEGQRILLIDDDTAVRQATALLLRLEGFTIEEAANLQDAQRCWTRGGAPHLVISDYHLGDGTTGQDVLAALRRDFACEPPLLFVTGDTSQLAQPLRSLSQDRILRKPVDPERLLSKVQELLAAALPRAT